MNYKLIGKLPLETTEFFKKEILERNAGKPFNWVHFDDYLNSKFMEIFENDELKIKRHPQTGQYVQKAVVVDPTYGMRIHKDGYADKGALNIAMDCNPGDWVRWYDENFINYYCVMNDIPIKKKSPKFFGDLSSRNTDIYEFDDVPFIQEVNTQVGDVYVVDTDVWHSFKCVGNKTRIILQTKFEGDPTADELIESLSKKSFKNLL